jgi:hypothetical protein
MARVNAIGTGFDEGDIDDIVCIPIQYDELKELINSYELEISKR